MPDLDFRVERAEPIPYAASPQLGFYLEITETRDPSPIHAIALRCQIRIEPARRQYGAREQKQLLELFGEPSRWGQTLRPMLWTHTSTIVPAFQGATSVEMPVPCSYDFNLGATKYFYALEEGDLPLLLLFSGTIFYDAGEQGLQVAQIPWEKEASFRMPIRVWRTMMEHYYPNSSWLCLRKDVFDRLYEFKSQRSLLTWEQTLERLLESAHAYEVSPMNRQILDNIVSAVLYEGYMLYPYRPSVKNRQRWTFGGLYPQAYSQAQGGTEPWTMQTECLIRGGPATRLEVQVRFLHLMDRKVGKAPQQIPHDGQPVLEFVDSLQVGNRLLQPWQEAVERESPLADLSLADLATRSHTVSFGFPSSQNLETVFDQDKVVGGVLARRQEAVAVDVEVGAVDLGGGVFRIRVLIRNQTPYDSAGEKAREEALLHCLASTHALLGVREGEFLSLFDPPAELHEAASACQNIGAWPVLVGEEGTHDTMLSSPIILYDYPRIAAESPGDLFDGTEIDEILTLRIMTLTDEEKRSVAAVDERSRALLERTESLAREQLMGLHGSLRRVRDQHDAKGTEVVSAESPIEDDAEMTIKLWNPWEEAKLMSIQVRGVELVRGSRVRLWPKGRADIMDMALAGKAATVASIEQDLENRVYVAVTVDEDPGKDLGEQSKPGHRFFFHLEEVEPMGLETEEGS